MVPVPPSTKPALSYTHHRTLRGQDGVLWLEGCRHVRAGRPSLHERELREGLWLLRDGITDSLSRSERDLCAHETFFDFDWRNRAQFGRDLRCRGLSLSCLAFALFGVFLARSVSIS